MYYLARNVSKVFKAGITVSRCEKFVLGNLSGLKLATCTSGQSWRAPSQVICQAYSTLVKDAYVKLGSHDFHVHPGFGVVRAEGHDVDFLIKPASPQEYPDADRAFVNVYGLTPATADEVKVELRGDNKDTLAVSAAPDSSRVYCEIQVPIKYDIDVNLKDDACIRIQGMEADEVAIATEKGEVVTRGLKSHNIRINTHHGAITAEGTLQGNIYITAKSTFLQAKRLQGLKMNILAEELQTNVSSSYMNQGQITTQRGNVVLNHLHGSTKISMKQGHLSLSGLHGHLDGEVDSGHVDVQVTEVTQDSSLKLGTGTMVVSILEQPRHNLKVTSPNLEVDEEISNQSNAALGVSELSVEAGSPDANTFSAEVTNGSAKVQQQDWFSTLGIKLGS